MTNSLLRPAIMAAFVVLSTVAAPVAAERSPEALLEWGRCATGEMEALVASKDTPIPIETAETAILPSCGNRDLIDVMEDPIASYLAAADETERAMEARRIHSGLTDNLVGNSGDSQFSAPATESASSYPSAAPDGYRREGDQGILVPLRLEFDSGSEDSDRWASPDGATTLAVQHFAKGSAIFDLWLTHDREIEDFEVISSFATETGAYAAWFEGGDDPTRVSSDNSTWLIWRAATCETGTVVVTYSIAQDDIADHASEIDVILPDLMGRHACLKFSS